jgi:hypothetical protein
MEDGLEEAEEYKKYTFWIYHPNFFHFLDPSSRFLPKFTSWRNTNLQFQPNQVARIGGLEKGGGGGQGVIIAK